MPVPDERLRVHQLANELGKPSRDLLAVLKRWGQPLKSASSHLEDEQVSRLRAEFARDSPIYGSPTELFDELKRAVVGDTARPHRLSSREQSAATRRRNTLDALLTAAGDLVSTDGPSVKAERITEASGVSLATFYAIFDSRDKLLHYLLQRAIETAGYSPVVPVVQADVPRSTASYQAFLKLLFDNHLELVRGSMRYRYVRELPAGEFDLVGVLALLRVITSFTVAHLTRLSRVERYNLTESAMAQTLYTIETMLRPGANLNESLDRILTKALD